jgi:Tfp pilus assembly protein PilX
MQTQTQAVVDNEKGVVIIVVLLVLVLLTIIGMSGTTDTVVELQVAANDKHYREAFYMADSGAYATPKIISNAIDANALPSGADLGSFSFIARPVGDSTTFFRQIMGFDAYDGGTRDVAMTIGTETAEMDVRRAGQENIVGSGVEFASGAEGAGVGSLGGVGIRYNIDSFGTAATGAATTIGVVYRKVTGVPGGL